MGGYIMKKSKVYWLFLLPSLLGVLLFYTIPFLFSLYYALVDNMGAQEFVGLKNLGKPCKTPCSRVRQRTRQFS